MLINTLQTKDIKRADRATVSLTPGELQHIKAIITWRNDNGFPGTLNDFLRLCLDNSINPAADLYIALPTPEQLQPYLTPKNNDNDNGTDQQADNAGE